MNRILDFHMKKEDSHELQKLTWKKEKKNTRIQGRCFQKEFSRRCFTFSCHNMKMFTAQLQVLYNIRQNTREECSVSGCGALPTQGREMILVSAVCETQLNLVLIPPPRSASLVHQLALGFMWTWQLVIASLYRKSSWIKQVSFQRSCEGGETTFACILTSIDSQ